MQTSFYEGELKKICRIFGNTPNEIVVSTSDNRTIKIIVQKDLSLDPPSLFKVAYEEAVEKNGVTVWDLSSLYARVNGNTVQECFAQAIGFVEGL